MAKKVISQSKGIEICIEQMSLGKSRREILQYFTKNYKFSDSTIDKWARQARKTIESRKKEAEQIRIKETEQAIAESVKQGLKSDLELEVFLCQIAMGDLQIEDIIRGNTFIRNTSPIERIRAIEVIYKKRGSYAPEKTQSNISAVVNMVGMGDERPLSKNENDVDN